MQYCSEYVTSQIDCGLILKKKKKEGKRNAKTIVHSQEFLKILVILYFWTNNRVFD